MDLKIRENISLGKIQEKDATSNARLKSYKYIDILQIASKPIFKEKDLEERKPCDSSVNIDFNDLSFECKPEKSKEVQEKNNDESFKSAKARAKSAVRSICMMNDFEYMFTWTLNGAIVDRYKPDEVYKKVRAFLSNATQRKGFKYVLIPEYHKDMAIHFHGLCILGKILIEPALTADGLQRVTKSGRPIFNMMDWKLGYSTAVALEGDYLKAVSYITKYVTKSEEKILGKYYLSSRGIEKKPDIFILKDLQFKDVFQLDEEYVSQYENSPYEGLTFLSTEFKKNKCMVYNSDGEVLH